MKIFQRMEQKLFQIPS